MSGDAILRRELRSPSRESLQMYLSRYVLLLQRKYCSFYKYISELKQKIPFHKAIFRNMCRQQWAPTYSGHPGFMFKTRSIYLIYFHLVQSPSSLACLENRSKDSSQYIFRILRGSEQGMLNPGSSYSLLVNISDHYNVSVMCWGPSDPTNLEQTMLHRLRCPPWHPHCSCPQSCWCLPGCLDGQVLQGVAVSLVELQDLKKQKGPHHTLLIRLPSTPNPLLLALLQYVLTTGLWWFMSGSSAF